MLLWQGLDIHADPTMFRVEYYQMEQETWRPVGDPTPNKGFAVHGCRRLQEAHKGTRHSSHFRVVDNTGLTVCGGPANILGMAATGKLIGE